MSFKVLVSSFMLLIPFSVTAQNLEDDIVENLVENLADNMPEDFDYEELSERLMKYKKSPIDLNKSNKDLLKELPFLSPIQINNLLNHIQANGKLLDIYELQSIDAFDLETIKLLLNFATVNPPNALDNFSFRTLSQGSHDYLLRYSRILKAQKGFTINPDSDKSRYLGSADKIFSRYRFNFKNNIHFSLNMEKDAGEYLWNHKGPDFISTSLFIKNAGIFSKIVIGDYSLQFGQGLSLWSGLSFGKGSDIFSVTKQDLGLKPYTSINENSFFRGISTEIRLANFRFTPFVSYRKIDASYTQNENQEYLVNTLQQTGLHRTPNEIANRKILGQLVYGGNLEFSGKSFSSGVNIYKTHFEIPFTTQSTLYKRFDFNRQNLNNIGFHYTKSFRNIYFFGEAAHSFHSGYAFLNGVLASLSNQLSLSLFQRNYQKNYHSFFNQALSENSFAYNEKGFYYAINYKYGKKYDISLYADLFKFPWLKYRVDAPSSGYEVFGQFSYLPSKNMKLLLRYKLKEKEENAAESGLEFYRRQNYRFEIQYRVNEQLSLKNRAEITQYHKASTRNQYGFLVFQDIKYAPLNSKLSGNLRYTLFDTDGFDTRIYTYESDVLYAYSIPGFQNKGMRFYVNCRYKIKRRFDFWMKYSITKYDEISSIGSGLDEINGNIKPEIRLQLRYQL